MGKIAFFFVTIFFFLLGKCHSDNKLIFLISPPRSLSTVFARMMHENKDFEIFHEPGFCPCGFTYYPFFAPIFYPPDAPHEFEEIQGLIQEASKKGKVFIKEMGFAAGCYLFNMMEVIQSKTTYFVFLLRDPHPVLLSYYKKIPFVHPLVNDIFDYGAIYALFLKLQDAAANPPLVILAEDLCKDPEKTLRHYFEAVQEPFEEKYLHWQSLGENFSALEWHDHEHHEQFLLFHKDALLSTGFKLPNSYAIDKEGKPTFEEIGNISHRHFLLKIYEENLPFYQLFKEKAHAN